MLISIGRPPSFYAGMETKQLFWSFVFTSSSNIRFCCFFFSFFFCRLMPHEKVFRYKKVQFSRKEGRKSSTDNRKITQKKGHFVDYYWKKKPLLTCVQEVWTTTTKQRWSSSSKNKSWKEKKRFEFYFSFLPQCCWWSAKLCKHFLSGEFWRSK